jgi:serine/threonine-protein kinase
MATSSVCPRCGAALAADTRFCPSCGAPTAPRLSPGQILDGKYEILDKIGEGGMGEVYRARHVHLDEIRIIKVTKPDALGEGPEPRRFQQEARMAAQVRHGNVAALHDFARLPDGSFYMVWEYIDGVTLEERLRANGPMPPAIAIDVARQILAGLAAIHAQGIVHRDISPDNIMIRERPGGVLEAKIIDLGIAKRVAAESVQMTGTGLFLGKLKYCSPEQVGSLSGNQAVDGRSDLYSFGVVLYEMLTGRAPFEAQTPEGYLGKHLHEAPPPLDTSRLPAAIGAPLSGVVRKALEKSREKRFSTAADFSEALARVPVLELETAPTERLARAAAGSRRFGLVFGAVVAALLLMAAVFWLRSRREPPRPMRPTPMAITTAVPSSVTPPPSVSPDETPAPASEGLPAEIGVERTKAPRPSPRRGPDADDPPAAPVAVSTATQQGEPPAPAVLAPPPERMRELIRRWRSHPRERRAREAQSIAAAANAFVAANPSDPLAREITARLPGELKADTEDALENAQPMLAGLCYRAWRALDFEPEDLEFERRVAASLSSVPPRRRPGGGN